MQRPVSVAVLVAFCWLMFGVHEATWARQEPAQPPANQSELSNQVRLISPGTEIKVFLTGRRLLEGTLREVENDAIVVDHKKGGGSTRVTLAEIEKVQTKGKGHRTTTYVLVGVAVGVGTLLALAVSTCDVSAARQRS